MKATLYSINRPHTDNIKSGRKLWEIRKTKPNIPVPFTSLIYETKKKGGCGKVIGEFICDKIHEIEYCGSQYLINKDIALTNRVAKESCLYYDDLRKYIGAKKGYALHISNLKIYDKPKELSEFKLWCDRAAELDMMVGDGKLIYGDFTKDRCLTCMRSRPVGRDYGGNGISIEINCNRQIERPPQSWCYVETQGE